MPVNPDNYPFHVPRLFFNSEINGILLVGAYVDDNLDQAIRKIPLPVVLVDGYSSLNNYDAVVSDNYAGAYEAVSQLILRGHRKIGLVGAHPNSYPSLRDRRIGYQQALLDHNISETVYADCLVTPDAAYEATIRLIGQHPEITAIFGVNDEIAISAMRAISTFGLRVPQDISVIGFDDINLAAHVTPPLTTMQVDKTTMGRIAMLLLSHRIHNPLASPVIATLLPRFIERQSVRNIC